MIVGFRNLESFNDGTTKRVCVSALEDATGGAEDIKFVIINQTQTVKVNFAANQEQTVCVNHTASSNGRQLVTVSATGSTQTLSLNLDVNKQPSDNGV